MNSGQNRRDTLASSYRIAISNGRNHTTEHVHDTLGTLDIINLVDNRCESGLSDNLSVSTQPSWIGLPETPFNSVNCTKPKKLSIFNSTYTYIFFLVWIAITITLVFATVIFVGKYHRDNFGDQIDILVMEIEKISIEKRQIENELEKVTIDLSKCKSIQARIQAHIFESVSSNSSFD